MNVFLIHSADDVEVLNERLRILDTLLPQDQRDEDLTEFNPSGNRPLTLSALLPDLLAELGTVSFFPGTPRVAVVNDLSDFWAARQKPRNAAAKSAWEAGKKPAARKAVEPVERLLRYLEHDFESTGNALIFTVLEDPDKRRTVDKRRKLVEWIKANGQVISFDSRPAIFAFADAILEGNLPNALGLFRESYRKGRADQAMALFSAILRQVHFLLQAKIASAAQRQELSEAFISADLLPGDSKTANLMKMHPFPRGKYVGAARRFTVAELTQALQDLYQINRHILPSPDDPYVADVGYLMERLLIRLCSRSA